MKIKAKELWYILPAILLVMVVLALPSNWRMPDELKNASIYLTLTLIGVTIVLYQQGRKK